MQSRFDIRLQALSPDIQAKLAETDSLKGRWVGGAQLSPQALGRLKRSVLVTSTGASTRIEGARISDAEIEKLMRGLTTQKLLDRDAQEVKGYYELLTQVFDNYDNIPLSENIIKQLHNQLLQYADKDERHRGDYKHLENRVDMKDAESNVLGVLFETTPAYLTAKEMQELVDWTRGTLQGRSYHPLLITANFVVEFLKIHPFLDGNGRMSRVLTNLLLLRSGYAFAPYISHEKIIEDNKTEYYVALRQAQRTFRTESETITPWVIFFLEVVREQAERALGLLSGDNLRDLLSPSQLVVWNVFESEETELTVKRIAKLSGVPRPTVKQALSRLLQLKKIERLGLGRATRYRRIS